jgi:Co/Zn/Cd efflux system component
MVVFKNNIEHKVKIFGFSSAKDLFKAGIFFWVGAGVYSLINLIMNLRYAPNIPLYDGIITGVAVIGLIVNIILLKKNKN